MRTVNTFVEAVEAFIDAAPWLGDADLPGVMSLRKLAAILDDPESKMQAALLSQYNMTFRDLRSREPKTAGGNDDALGRALDDAQQRDLFTIYAEQYDDEAKAS